MNKKPFLVALSVLALAVPTTAQAATPTGAARFTSVKEKVDSSVLPKSLQDDSSVNVIVEMAGDPVAVVQARAGRDLSDSEKSAIKSDLKSKQDAVRGGIAAKGGRVTADMQSAYNGLAVTLRRTEAAALETLPGVVAVHEATRQELTNAVSVPYLGVPAVWQNSGYTGKGVKVAVIDTGIDYTHADFGGPGTAAAYAAAHASETSAADPALFGPSAPRIKGGIDLVGDAYDANTPGSVPTPDANPLDCAGHGSHVAGTIGGSGVTEAGTAYAGPYGSSTYDSAFKIGPGVAPEADLYAVRVFGCTGSTDVTTQAIDWAVKNGMNVINMSLGSPFGRADDPAATAAANAVASGVVVVASAGNSGPNPYLTGSPATGRGVISVAASDSTQDFPGTLIGFSDGTTLQAINANGMSPLPAGPFTIVILANDPATAENEALGCSVAAYTKNGVTGGANQLAVSTRGTCGRVSKAIYAQQAGAAVALMVNNSAAYPPYEGAITANPDTGDAFNVTIPFLGVRGGDRAKLVAEETADSTVTTLTANRLTNPAYTSLADFSSAGPRNGDSGLKPGVTAPGVSIFSVAVGTGNGGEVMSGTSMAAPHVAGAAALVRQAHPGWSIQDLTAALTSTADPDKVGGGTPYRLTLGGGGLIDVAQAVGTKTVALGDSFTANGVSLRESALNFGFAEPTERFRAEKSIVIRNNGSTAMTYAVSSAASAQSKPGNVTFDKRSVQVPAHGSATVKMTLTVKAGDIPTSEGAGFQFYEVSGNVVLTATGSTLRVPYLLVPRPAANASVSGSAVPMASGFKQVLENKGTTYPAGLDFYAWGLSDARDNARAKLAGGFDLRAAGVAAVDSGDPADPVVVFALNNWNRASNMAVNEFDVTLDTTGDGKPDYVVFSADYGLVTAGESNGRSGTFIYDLATKSLGIDFYTIAPTDSSTVLLPVMASSLGLTKAAGDFTYSVTSYSLEDATLSDEMPGVAKYNPFVKILGEGSYLTLKAGEKVVPGSKSNALPIDMAAYQKYAPLGEMVVVFDNPAGADEALLLGKGR